MAASVVYSTWGGQIVHENRGGVERGYVPDTLGSTIALVDSTGTITDTWKYWPYGEVSSRTGTNATPFTYIGTLGYFKDLVSKLTYIRARFYQSLIGQWMTTDPIGPLMMMSGNYYAYSIGAPTSQVDSDGLLAQDPFETWKRKMERELPDDDDIRFVLKHPCYRKVLPRMQATAVFGKSRGGHDRINALGHCMTACLIAREVPECVNYWKARELGAGVGHKASLMDQWNNDIGFLAAKKFPKTSCKDLCQANESLLTWYEPHPYNWPPGKGIK